VAPRRGLPLEDRMSRSVIPKDHSRRRSAGFLMRTGLATLVLIAAVGGIYFLNDRTGVFKTQLAQVDEGFEAIDSALLSKIATGVSVGAVLILVAVFALPLFMKSIDSKEYVKNIVLGLVSSFVFYLSQSLYDTIGKRGKLYVALSMAVVAFITFFIVELLALAFKSKKRGVEFRTAVLGGIASGLAFGIVLELVKAAVAAIGKSL
jgi:hypothetical protein